MFYCKSDMHVRPMRFSVLCTPTNSSNKAQSMCSTILLCLFPSKSILMEAGWTTVQCPATNLRIVVRYVTHLQEQSLISVALKTPLEIRLGICIYKTALLHRPGDYIGFTPSCPPIFYNNIAPIPDPAVLPVYWRQCSVWQRFILCWTRTSRVLCSRKEFFVRRESEVVVERL